MRSFNDVPGTPHTQEKKAAAIIPCESLRLATADSDRPVLFSLTPGFSPVYIPPDRT